MSWRPLHQLTTLQQNNATNATEPTFQEISFQVAIPTANVLSIIGGCFIIVNVLVSLCLPRGKAKNHNDKCSGRPSRHQIFMLMYAFNSILLCIGGLIYASLDFANNRAICTLQALHISYFNLTSWFWSCAITANIFVLLQYDASLKTYVSSPTTKLRNDILLIILTNVICWGIPFVLVLVLALVYGHTITPLQTWCWISPNNYFVRFLFFYGWAIASWVINLVTFVATTISLFVQHRRGGLTYFQQLSGRIAIYAIVFLICWVFGFVMRAIQVFDSSWNNFWLNFVHTVLSLSCTFWVAIVFIYCERLWETYRLRKVCTTICCCCCKARQQEDLKKEHVEYNERKRKREMMEQLSTSLTSEQELLAEEQQQD